MRSSASFVVMRRCWMRPILDWCRPQGLVSAQGPRSAILVRTPLRSCLGRSQFHTLATGTRPPPLGRQTRPLPSALLSLGWGLGHR